jgi:hypothetical protein
LAPWGTRSAAAPVNLPLTLNVHRSIVTLSHPDRFGVPVPIVLLPAPPHYLLLLSPPLLIFKCPPPMPPMIICHNILIVRHRCCLCAKCLLFGCVITLNQRQLKNNNNWRSLCHVHFDSAWHGNHQLLTSLTSAAG